MSRLAAFDAHLRAAGVPIDGLSLSAEPPGPRTVTVQFRPEATSEQRAWAAQALETFDWRRRRPLPDATVAAALAGLTSQQQQAVQRRLLARLLKADPEVAAQILADLGVALPVDEVDPT